jgi:hypothetical protein
MERVFGGQPFVVLAKLLFVSLVVGAILAGLGFDPMTLPRHLLDAVRSLFRLGFGAFRDVGRYILTGAIIVIPLWILSRFLLRPR